MALSGSVTTTSSHNRSLRLSWTASQDNVNNMSTISWTLKGSGSASGFIKVHTVKVTIDGSIVYNVSDANCECYNGTTVANGSKTISHKSDGTKSFTIKVEAGIYTYAVNCSGSSTFTLNTIALSSIISSATNTTLGNRCQIAWTPAAPSYTYKLNFILGDWSYTTGIIAPNQTSEYSYNGFTIPIDGVAQQIPNSKTGTMTAYLYTYSDSNATKQIGSTSSKTFTVTVPNTLTPTLSNVTAEIDNSANDVAQSWGIAIANISKVRVRAVGSVGNTYGSSISGYTLSSGYNVAVVSSSSLDYTGSTINSSGEKVFTVTTTDSRGYISQPITSASITFYDYNEPEITSFSAQRVYSESSDGRTKIRVKGNWAFDSVGDRNAATAELKYRKTSNGSWINFGNITQHKNTFIEIECPSGGNSETGFPETESYDFRLVVTDSLGSKAVSQVLVPTAEVLLDFKAGGKGLGVGRVAESDRVEIGLDTVFMKSVNLLDFGIETTLEDFIYSVARSLAAPQIIIQPESREITLGDAITISLKARGVGLTYQWYFKKTDQSSFNKWNNHTSDSENVTPNATWNGIQLYCAITDSNGNVSNSDIITITLNQG